MSHGQYGYDHRKARAASAGYSALRTLQCWRMGRTHLADAVDDALSVVVREQDSSRPKASQSVRRSAAATLRGWIKSNPHLPADLVAALHTLLPEIGQGTMADDWPAG